MSCYECPSISIFAGRDQTVQFTLTTGEVPYDLTGAKVWLTVKDETADPDSEALILKRSLDAGGADTEVNIVDAENGILEVYFVPADTVDLDTGDSSAYWFDVVVENSEGKQIQAVQPSRFTVKYTVTRVPG